MTEDFSAIYGTKEWFESLSWQHPWINFMAGWWAGEFGVPESVLDFGCGDGHWLKAFKDMTTAVACGVELFPIANDFVPNCAQLFIHDLREPLELGKRAELVLCLEVAEHMNREAADTLCYTLVTHTKNNLLFSAAGPGQAGTGHINLQPPAYWTERIERFGHIKFSAGKTGKVRSAFKNIVNECFEFLPRNVMVFSVV